MDYFTNKPKTIFRTVKRESPYVQIDKTVLNDTRLSWKAKGLMAFLLSKPDDWRIIIGNLISQSKDGRDAVYSTIDELIENGYIVRKEERQKGRFSMIEYLIYETPQFLNSENPPDKTVNNEKSHSDKHQFKTSIQPYPENPDTTKSETDNPNTKKPPLLKNNFLLNNDFTKNSPSYSPNIKRGRENLLNLKILEPVALKLFEQSNFEILHQLRMSIKEFDPDETVINECLKQINAKEIKANPYAYFRIKYMVSVAQVSKRTQAQKEQNLIEQQFNEKFSISTEVKDMTVEDTRAEIRKKLGIKNRAQVAKKL